MFSPRCCISWALVGLVWNIIKVISNSENEKFSGITETNEEGQILKIDSDDWRVIQRSKSASILPNILLQLIPTKINVLAGYPNPTSDKITIGIEIPERTNLKIYIINEKNEQIRLLVDQVFDASYLLFVWDLKDSNEKKLEPGVYRCQIDAGHWYSYGDIKII